MNSKLRRVSLSIINWFDSYSGQDQLPAVSSESRKVDWIRLVPFWALHVLCLGVLWVGWSPIAVAFCIGFYVVRMFSITGFYHRYFSHRTFKTSRLMQFAFAFMGNSSGQRGALWWAAHHREHHRFSDEEADPHSPHRQGFLKSHMLWFASKGNYPTKTNLIKDFAKYPELRFLDRFDSLVPLVVGFTTYLLGWALELYAPSLGTNGLQMLFWGFFLSTVLVFHGTFSINSLGHIIGRKRYHTKDQSKNSLFLALITLGEGWHNNHHYYQSSTRQGFYWWEIDITFYGLWIFSKLGLIWDLKPVPVRLRDINHIKSSSQPVEWPSEDVLPSQGALPQPI